MHDVEHEAEHGYTSDASRALFAEPEAVDREEQRRITAAAARSAREADRDEWFRRREAIERELDWLFSRRFQRDVTVQVRALRRQLDRVDRRLQV